METTNPLTQLLGTAIPFQWHLANAVAALLGPEELPDDQREALLAEVRYWSGRLHAIIEQLPATESQQAMIAEIWGGRCCTARAARSLSRNEQRPGRIARGSLAPS